MMMNVELHEVYDTYKVQIVVFDGKKWNYYEPKHAICEHHCTCIHLFTRKETENVKKSSV